MPFGRPDVVAPAKKKPEFVVKATNLAASVTEATLKIALETWGVTGISEVQIAPSRHGTPMALVKFKTENDAEKMLQARGVSIDGKPLAVEPMRTAMPSKRAEPTKGMVEQASLTTFVKVSGLPKEVTDKEIITFLRQYGVLGIVEAAVAEDGEHAVVELQTADNVKSAIMKANGKALKGMNVTLEPHNSWTSAPIQPAARAPSEGAAWPVAPIGAPMGKGDGGKARWGPYDRPAPGNGGGCWNDWGKGGAGAWGPGGGAWKGGKGGYGKM
mmetsp:Transcript_27892/g.64805  ORF Transcript_27892/g.64805 Transcript_27892/m.64805 type:complete len:271 (-) Transcript_27892:138-950(-)